ncbi:FimV family protein [Polaromonas sp. A23]|uniref:type IV pilus assembly protein FimV n=1 Tax=Polaromonas sp. A23 TaxID=1944133 RepID=UPI00157D1319|nr:hypothetical protein [Polaromonas sp. A23]
MKWIFAAGVLLVLCSGCASVTHGTTQPLRIDTENAKGELIDDADCVLVNDHGTTHAQSGRTSPVRRSGQDLRITCTSPGLPEASGRLVSRANAGLAGNLIIGGGIGALVDHNSGAAYTYPSWVRLVFGYDGLFDRRNEQQGSAMAAAGSVGSESSASPVPSAPGATTPAATVNPSQAASRGPVRSGDTFDYLVTDRMTGRSQTVLLRADRADDKQISFNNGARIEKQNGEVVSIVTAIAGELDLATPPGGWMPGGRLPRGSWGTAFTTRMSGVPVHYDLVANADRERPIRTPAGEFRAIRIDLRGWVENRNSRLVSQAPYEAIVWFSPELRRVVRFEAKAPSPNNLVSSINEVAELTRIGRD